MGVLKRGETAGARRGVFGWGAGAPIKNGKEEKRGFVN